MKKKSLIILLCVAVISCLAIGATIAYFYDTDDATNTFTVGNVSIDLTEPNWEGTDDVYPGQLLAKDPVVKNTGSNPCVVRIKLEMPSLPQGDVSFYTDGTEGKLGDDWEDGGDGYYYYLKSLDSGYLTSKLFEQIGIPIELENGTPPTNSYDVKVMAQAIQSQSIDDPTDISDIKAMFDKVTTW